MAKKKKEQEPQELKESLAVINAKAREAGLSYGQYVAKIQRDAADKIHTAYKTGDYNSMPMCAESKSSCTGPICGKYQEGWCLKRLMRIRRNGE